MSVSRVDQTSSSSSSVRRRSSLIVNLSTSTSKKRSSVTTHSTSTLIGGNSSNQHRPPAVSFRSYSSTAASPLDSLLERLARDSFSNRLDGIDCSLSGGQMGGSGTNMGVNGASVGSSCRVETNHLFHVRAPTRGSASPQSAPPSLLSKPTYCTSSIDEDKASNGASRTHDTEDKVNGGQMATNTKRIPANDETNLLNNNTNDNTNRQQQQQQLQVVEVYEDIRPTSRKRDCSLERTEEKNKGTQHQNQNHTKGDRLGVSSSHNSQDKEDQEAEEISVEPIVEVKHTSSSSSSSPRSGGSPISSRYSSDCEDHHSSSSSKLIRRRTVRRYHRATEECYDELPTTTNHNNNKLQTPQQSSKLLSIVPVEQEDQNSDKKPRSPTIITKESDSRPTKDTNSTNTGWRQQEQSAGVTEEATRSHFRTRQIGSYQTQSKQQQQHQQQAKTQHLTSSTSSSKIAKSSTITTNRKSTTSSRQLVSESISTKAATGATNTIRTSSDLTRSAPPSASIQQQQHQEEQTMAIIQDGFSQATSRSDNLELRLGLQNQKSTGALFERAGSSSVASSGFADATRSSIEVKQEEESSVHHRESFSSSTSLRNGQQLRESAISRSSASSSEAASASLSRHGLNGNITSADLSASSSSSRHFKSSSSLFISGNSNRLHQTDDPHHRPFLTASDGLFSSPDVRSLVKEIGTDFAELENALSSTSLLAGGAPAGLGNSIGLHGQSPIARPSSGVSTRLFGPTSAIHRRPLSPLRTDQYPAIMGPGALTANEDETIIPTPKPFHAKLGSRLNSNVSLASSSVGSSSLNSPTSSSRSKIRELLDKANRHAEKYGSQPEATISTGQNDNTNNCDTPKAIEPLANATYDALGSRQSATSTNNNDTQQQELISQGPKERQEVKSLHEYRCNAVMNESIERIDQRMSDLCKKLNDCSNTDEAIDLLKIMIQMIEKAWSVPVCGDDLGFKLCNSLRQAGGLDIILGFIHAEAEDQPAAPIAMTLGDPISAGGQRAIQVPATTAKGPTSTSYEQQKQITTKNPTTCNNISKQNATETTNSSKTCPPQLKLNLTKLNHSGANKSPPLLAPTPSIATDSSTLVTTKGPYGNITNTSKSAPTSASVVMYAQKDSDSDILTSDLGLDSTSVESLSYVSAAQQTQTSEEEPSCQPSATIGNADKDNKQTITTSTKEDGYVKIDEEQPVDDAKTTASTTSLNEADDSDEAQRVRKEELVFLSARLLSQCLTSDNRDYIVQYGLDPVIRLACNFTTMKSIQSKRLLTRSALMRQSSSVKKAASKTQTFNDTNNKLVVDENNATTMQQVVPPQTGPNDDCNRGPSPVQMETLDVANSGQASAVTTDDLEPAESVQEPQREQLTSSEQLNDTHSEIGTETLQHLFKHSEETCSRMISLGGLQAILYGCRSSNVETLRHCASALANLALYGGPDSQQTMIEQKAHVWLFPLAFHEDDNVQYYACLAIVVLAANQEIEADVLKSSTLDLVEPFVTNHEPRRFAESTTAHIHGQSAGWLRKLIPLLESRREEARNLACFHFAMEAYIKREQGQTQVFREIGAVEPLRKAGSSPIAITSKFACQALRLIGEKEPHKLSQQVPLWTSDDVCEWVSQIGFERFRPAFRESHVDGDLLLQLDEEMLKSDIGIENGIIRRRFLRELAHLKRIADYSSVDRSGLSALLATVTNSSSAGPSAGREFVQYVYPMVQLGITRDNIHLIDCDQLLAECKIANTIHRMKLSHSIKELQERMAIEAASNERNSSCGTEQKTLDVFVSYRRSTGSQLASLLKVHLQLRGFSVFIDVERLEAGKFDNNLLDSIKRAKNFILVLSPNALDRCIGDHECKDWVHKEIVAALAGNCNIIPIIDNFHWPEAEQLPEDMRSITYFNGVRWIHDYQDACVDKVERFIRGEFSNSGGAFLGGATGCPGNSSIGSVSSINVGQSSLQRLAGGGACTSASTPSIVATPSLCSTGPQLRPTHPLDCDHHPLSYANSYLQHSQVRR